MGQAKLRGTFEERQAKAIERDNEARTLKEAQRKAQRRIYDAAYRSGMVVPEKKIGRTGAILLTSALASMAASEIVK